MDVTLLSVEFGMVRVDGNAMRRLSSPGSDKSTTVTLDGGETLTVPDCPGRILEKAGLSERDGRHGPFVRVDVVGDAKGAEYLHGGWIALLEKVREERDLIDPTRITLVDGQAVEVSDSIRTLGASLGFAGFAPVPIKIPTMARLAAVVPAAVVGAESMGGDRVVLVLKGGTEVGIDDPAGATATRIAAAAHIAPAFPAAEREPEPELAGWAPRGP